MQEDADAAYLREQAALCRRLADGITDQKTIATLRTLAEDYEAKANAIEGVPPIDGTSHPKMDMPPQ
jgi:hypothetical protein